MTQLSVPALPIQYGVLPATTETGLTDTLSTLAGGKLIVHWTVAGIRAAGEIKDTATSTVWPGATVPDDRESVG